MKNTLKNLAIGALGTAMLVGSAIKADAQTNTLSEQVAKQFEAGRVRTEYTLQEGSVNQLKTTFGVAPKGSYDGLPTVVKGNLLESFRAMETQDFRTGQSYTGAGVNIPLNFDGLKASTLVFGNFGSKNAIGLEETVSFGAISPSFSFERNLDNDSTRVGGELEVRPTDQLKFAIGFDKVEYANGSFTSQAFGRATYDLNKNDALGVAFAHKEDKGVTKDTLFGFWAHSPKTSKFGARFLYQFDTDSMGNQSHFGQFIFAPSKTAITGKLGAEYWIDRRSSYGEEPFSMHITPLSISTLQAIPLMDRTLEGPAFLLSGKHTSTKYGNTDNLTSGVAYVFKIGQKSLLATMADYSHTETPKGRQDVISPRFRFDFGNFEIGPRVSIPFQKGIKPTVFLEAQYNF